MTAPTAEPVLARSAPKLPRRQLAVLREIANGATNAEAARRLFMSTHTVDMYLHRVGRKLGTTGRGRAYLVAVALRLELIGLEEIALPPLLEARTAPQTSQARTALPGAPGAAGGPR
jgi:DNA-binding CsgD family transcriptional regulator